MHANPCFYAAAGGGTNSLEALPRNKWQELQDGDKFSLLPGACVFTVVFCASKAVGHGEASDSGTDVDESMQQAAVDTKAAASVQASSEMSTPGTRSQVTHTAVASSR